MVDLSSIAFALRFDTLHQGALHRPCHPERQLISHVCTVHVSGIMASVPSRSQKETSVH